MTMLLHRSGCSAAASRGQLQLRKTPRRACINVCCVIKGRDSGTQGLPASAPPGQRWHEASLDIGPYLVWDKALKLQATWDSRSHSQADLQAVCELLEGSAVDQIAVGHLENGRGQPLTSMTVMCKREKGDDVAAALLKWTPATHVSVTPCEQCYLPQHTACVDTPYGRIPVHLSLAGSRACKVTPDWQQCQQAAAAAEAEGAAAGAAAAAGAVSVAAGGGDSATVPLHGHESVDAAAVAAAAVECLQQGLSDGTIELATPYMY